MSDTKRPYIDDMYGYDNATYNKLLSSALYSQIITNSGLSLTLTNNLVKRIITTHNKKYRRKLIDELYDLLNVVDGNAYLPTPDDCAKLLTHESIKCVLHIVIIILYSYNCNNIEPREVPLRILHNGNSPWYTALVVGDSKHYTSCLRSGVLNSNINTHAYKEHDWVQLAGNKGIHDARGCNHRKYVSSEVRAFKSGYIVYLTAGEACYESEHSKGFDTRIRIHVVTESFHTRVTHQKEYAMFLVDTVYGNKEYVVPLLRLLHDTYPGRVYVTKYYKHPSYTNLKLGKEVITFRKRSSSVYSDYADSGYQLIEVGEPNYGPQYVLVNNRCTHTVNTKSESIVVTRDCVRDECSIYHDSTTVKRSLKYNKHKPSKSSVTESYFYSHWELAKVAEHYGKRLRFNEEYASHYLYHPFGGTRISIDYNTIRWTLRGINYAIPIQRIYGCDEYCSVLMKTVRDKRYTYNWVTGKWDILIHGHECKRVHHIPRKQFHKVLQLMPKSLTKKQTKTSAQLPF